MAPSQQAQDLNQSPQSPRIPAKLPKLRNPHLPELYAKQAQFQAELELIGDEASRLELAKAWYAARMAAERAEQNEREEKEEEQKVAREEDGGNGSNDMKRASLGLRGSVEGDAGQRIEVDMLHIRCTQ
ncbi:hypothetical protein EPUS_04508 [Endocarpon pusillum Z07020]|uniref:Uncharacterized protein n=1 Tax=Endocarpon pusillum (strain Z07020 / HMAS-L-300199) TaxID=1263415 RepID=U1GAX4_ENDPU|nr:uncharacterized protein EPUS_04508 [Endocarpon pusillum Z07020]ERF68856.1 hypothetical protein EPUS_04508 [Endocarpon pusillum Z07020]